MEKALKAKIENQKEERFRKKPRWMGLFGKKDHQRMKQTRHHAEKVLQGSKSV